MVKSNVNALGIIFPNSYDNMVPELVTERPFKHGKQRN